jgi:FtsH-binding integral membrane protein
MIFSFGWVVNRGTTQQVQMMFWGYAVLMGVSLTPAFLLYTQSSLVRVFLITAGAFGGLSLYGYTTKKDLSGMGSFLIMGLIGLIIASIVNIFVKPRKSSHHFFHE